MAGLAAAGPKKSGALPCSNELSCARKCGAKNKAACLRLGALLETKIQLSRSYKATRPSEVKLFEVARKNLGPACKAKQPEACVLLGQLEEIGLGGAADVASAEKRFSAACDKKVGAGCHALGAAYDAGSFGGKVPKLAFAAYQRGCDAGHQDSCAQLGVFTANGIGTTADVVAGLKMIDDACTRKSAAACRTLGYLYRAGSGVKVDDVRADLYHESACDLGNVLSCDDLVYRATDETRRRARLEKGCEHGSRTACYDLYSSAERTQETAVAVAAEERACALGSEWVCRGISDSYRAGTKGRKKDAKKAGQFLDLACDAGDQSACIDRVTIELPTIAYDAKTGARSLSGPLKKPALKKAIAGLSRLCDAGEHFACARAGDLYADELYGNVDLKKARGFYAKNCQDVEDEGPCYALEEIDRLIAQEKLADACDDGNVESCLKYGNEAFYASPKRASAALARACKGGKQAACGTLARDRYYKGDKSAAAEIQKSCDAGVADDCTWVGSTLMTTDPAASRAAFERGCELGAGWSCFELGLQQDTAGSDQAIATFERACDLDPNIYEACDFAFQRKEEAALRAEEATCAAGKSPQLCMTVATRIVASRPADALAAYDHACTGKLGDGCHGAAKLRTTGATGVTADPIRARSDAQKACDLGVIAACVEVAAVWEKTSDLKKATAAWVTACNGSDVGSCRRAADQLRTGTDKTAYKAVLDRGCMLGDSSQCDELKYPDGIRPEVAAAEPASSYSSSSYVDQPYRAPRRPRTFHRAMLFAGAFSVTPDDAVTFEDYKGGLLGVESEIRTRSNLGLMSVVRGSLSYDAESHVGHDAALGLGVTYGLGPLRLSLLGVGGHDGMGSPDVAEMAFGVDGAWYTGWELRGHTGLGRWSLGASYAVLSRKDGSSETRFDLTLGKYRESGSALGLGLRSVEYDAAGSIGGFLFVVR